MEAAGHERGDSYNGNFRYFSQATLTCISFGSVILIHLYVTTGPNLNDSLTVDVIDYVSVKMAELPFTKTESATV